jgi:hypothetical protein
MRVAVIASLLLLPLPSFAQTSSPSAPSTSPSTSAPSPSGPSSTSPSSQTPTVPAPPPLSPNVSPSQAAPVQSPGVPQVTPDPSPTQAAPLPSPVPTRGRSRPAETSPGTGSRVPGGQAAQTAEDVEKERQRREERLRASDERLRRLIRDICIGCESPGPARTRGRVVRAKG